MKFNLCIIKPKNFIHAEAFKELIDLLSFSLLDLNYETTISINEVKIGSQNIVFGCHLLGDNDLSSFPKSTIFFNTEQLYLENNAWTRLIFKISQKYLIWDYNTKNLNRLASEGASNAHLFEIGYHRKLNRINKKENQDIDVLFYGSINERRKLILDNLKKKNLSIKYIFGLYGYERDEYISRAKVVLNMHFYNSQIFEVIRIHYLVNNNIPVVTEVNTTTQIDHRWNETIFGINYNNLVKQCEFLVNNSDCRNIQSALSLKRLQEKPQVEIISDLLNKSFSLKL